MTIGPAPMIRTLEMSVRLGMIIPSRRARRAAARASGGFPGVARLQRARRLVRLHQPDEAIEQVIHVARPRARLGMALKAERGTIGAHKALQRSIEERNVGD